MERAKNSVNTSAPGVTASGQALISYFSQQFRIFTTAILRVVLKGERDAALILLDV